MGLNRLWTSHIKEKEDKEKFRREILSAEKPLTRLKEICESKRKECDKLRYSQESVEKMMPGGGFRDWLMFQAGKLAVYQELEGILDITKE